nr:VOC family protein [uncultured Macellibacteroides sp.]
MCHFAFVLENKEKVNAFTEQMRADSYHVMGEPQHITGYGFLESVIADPDGNRVELVAENI